MSQERYTTVAVFSLLFQRSALLFMVKVFNRSSVTNENPQRTTAVMNIISKNLVIIVTKQ